MSGTFACWKGNITKEPTVRFSSQGNCWVTFTIAVDRYIPGGDERTTETEFIGVKVLNSTLATHVAESVTKGSRVLVEGQVKVDSWTDPTGNKRNSVVLYATDVAASLRFNDVVIKARSQTPTPAASTPAPSTPEPEPSEQIIPF